MINHNYYIFYFTICICRPVTLNESSLCCPVLTMLAGMTAPWCCSTASGCCSTRPGAGSRCIQSPGSCAGHGSRWQIFYNHLGFLVFWSLERQPQKLKEGMLVPTWHNSPRLPGSQPPPRQCNGKQRYKQISQPQAFQVWINSILMTLANILWLGII